MQEKKEEQHEEEKEFEEERVEQDVEYTFVFWVFMITTCQQQRKSA